MEDALKEVIKTDSVINALAENLGLAVSTNTQVQVMTYLATSGVLNGFLGLYTGVMSFTSIDLQGLKLEQVKRITENIDKNLVTLMEADGKAAWDHFKIMEFELAHEKAVRGFHSAPNDEEKGLPIKLMCTRIKLVTELIKENRDKTENMDLNKSMMSIEHKKENGLIIQRNLDDLLDDDMVKRIWDRNLNKSKKIIPKKMRKSPELLEKINYLLKGCYSTMSACLGWTDSKAPLDPGGIGKLHTKYLPTLDPENSKQNLIILTISRQPKSYISLEVFKTLDKKLLGKFNYLIGEGTVSSQSCELDHVNSRPSKGSYIVITYNKDNATFSLDKNRQEEEKTEGLNDKENKNTEITARPVRDLRGVAGSSCELCFEEYSAANKPYVVCTEGHSFCYSCSDNMESCADCGKHRIEQMIVNSALLKMVEGRNESLSEIADIPAGDLFLEQDKAIAYGSYSQIFLYKWKEKKVALKKLQLNNKITSLKDLKKWTNISISLLHPNFVNVYGTTALDDGMMGIVMEYADMGALTRGLMDSLTEQQKVSISLGVCSGISFLHSKKVSHQHIKPENILLFGSEPIAKLSDFGVSKAIKTLGNPKYSAPELLETGAKQGVPIDVFSLSIIFFELFSGEDAFKEFANLLQIISAISQNKRPEMNKEFPRELGELVKKGWSRLPNNRPSIDQFKTVLEAMRSAPIKRMDSLNLNDIKIITVSFHDQVQEINLSSMVVPLISMKWNESSDSLLTKELRNNMIKNLKENSKMKNMITLSVIKAMEVVPRHLFMESSRISGESLENKLEYVYTYNKAMGATKHSNESAPEIIGAQLSLVKIETGATVLMVGGKGGYINSLVAQLVGINGRVITVSANREILTECKARVDLHSPFKHTMEWKKVPNLDDIDNVLDIMDAEIKSIHAIIFCGATNTLPTRLAKLLSPTGGAIIAPVITGPRKQQLQLFIQSADGLQEIRHITEFGVIFGEVKDM